MPDWKNPADYKFTTELRRDPASWAWEFLRRNNEYRSYYKKSTIGGASVYDPPKNAGESDNAWRARVALAGGDPRKLALAVWSAYQWHMRPPIVDPDGSKVPTFESRFPRQLLFFDQACPYFDDEEPQPIAGHYAILVFDLRARLGPQLATARRQLRPLKSGLKQTRRRNISPKKWTLFLRLLDAEAADAKPKEIRARIEVYAVQKGLNADKHRAADLFSDHRSAARALRDDPLAILY
jgi:hypothetical protein